MKRPWIWGLAGLVIVLLAVVLDIWIDRLQSDDADAVAGAAPAAATAAAIAPAIRPSPETKQAPAADARPGFDVVRVNPNGDAVIAGHAAPDAVVTVLDGDRVVGTATADHGGDWVLVPSNPLGAGSRELSLSARIGEGTPLLSDKTVVVVVPGGKAAESGGGNALALMVPRSGAGASTLLQAPSDRLPGPPLSQASIGTTQPRAAPGIGVDVIDYGESGRLALSGHAAPGANLRIYLDNAPVGSAQADRLGVWHLTPDQPVKPGLYHLRVDELGAGGQVARRIELPFAQASLSPDLLGRDRLVVQPGNSLWRIAREAYGEGLRYSVIYQANREQIRDPDLIYPGQILSVPAPPQ